MQRLKLRFLFCCLAICALMSSCKTITCGCPMAQAENPENDAFAVHQPAAKPASTDSVSSALLARGNSW